MSFIELDQAIKKISNSKFWASELLRIETHPITFKSIDELINHGWKITFKNRWRIGEWDPDALCVFDSKEIYLSPRLEPYERDVSLFHEIVHAYYDTTDMSFFVDYHRFIAEWEARRLRRKPRLLRKAISAFGLEPKIYDYSSHLAFEPGQLYLPFPEDIFGVDFKPGQLPIPFRTYLPARLSITL